MTIKRSLITAGFVKGIKLHLKSVLTRYNTFSSICKGDIEIKEVNEPPTDQIKEIMQIPKKGIIYFKDVKKAYPQIAESIGKEFFKGKSQLKVEEVMKMIDEIAPEDDFWISLDKWEGGQKDLDYPQIVVQLNFDQKILQEIEKNETVKRFFDDFSISSAHPAHAQTFAWARVYRLPQKWIVEEMQNDLVDADTKFSDKIDSVLKDFTEEELGVVAEFLSKHLKDWDKKLLGTVIELARKENAQEVWIFDDEYKKKYTKSLSKLQRYYKEVPRDLGFKREVLRCGSVNIPAWKRPVASIGKKVRSALETSVALPVPVIKDLLKLMYKAVLKSLNRFDADTWLVFNLALTKMSDEETKQEWKAVTDGTVNEIVENLKEFENKDKLAQVNIMKVFDDLSEKYFEENVGESKEKLEQAHTQIREFFKKVKQDSLH